RYQPCLRWRTSKTQLTQPPSQNDLSLNTETLNDGAGENPPPETGTVESAQQQRLAVPYGATVI
ncbi:hypothetical protein CWN04_30545, partial [Klebsiella michiganensis]